MALRITGGIAIPEEELEESFTRASGPGGQNVNKVASAVMLRFDALGSDALPDYAKRNLARIAGQAMTRAGVVVIHSDRYRSQPRNREDAREKLVELLRVACERPKHRIPTRPGRNAKRKRTDSKTKRGKTKALRKRPDAGGD